MALPKLQVGRFLRKTVAPLIPGGAAAAESVNGIIKDVKGRTAEGENLVSATKASLTEANTEAAKAKYLRWALIGGAVLLVILLVRRR